MNENAAIDMLTHEHKIILKVVHGMHGLAQQLKQGRTVDLGLLNEAIEFMREFADRCHHAKEEDLLFPALVQHGVPLHGCPLDALLHEHSEGRRLVSRLEEAVEGFDSEKPETRMKLVDAIEAIERLYPNHIWKEEEMVFPMAGRLIPTDALLQLYAGFEEVESRNPPGIHERFHEFAARIADSAALDDKA